jgi:hypothetical protein
MPLPQAHEVNHRPGLRVEAERAIADRVDADRRVYDDRVPQAGGGIQAPCTRRHIHRGDRAAYSEVLA